MPIPSAVKRNWISPGFRLASPRATYIATCSLSAVAILVGAAPALAQNSSGENSATGPTAPLSEALEPQSSTNETKPFYAAGPEGKTLPENVLRVRIPVRQASANSGFDADGNKQDLGLTLSATGAALVVEYGVSDALSIQLLAPFVVRNEVGLDGDTFRRSKVYQEKYTAFVQKAAALMAQKGLCSSVQACVTAIEAGKDLPVDTPVPLPSGEVLIVKAKTPVKDAADSLVVRAATPASGKIGLGDMELGALYALSTEKSPLLEAPVYISIGGGLRFPTGQFKDVPSAYRNTSRGTLDAALRTNVDYNPCAGLFLSWQNQAEVMLVKGKKNKTSLVDNTQLNSADPTSAAALAAGSDGKANEQSFSRKGLRHIGFLKAAWGLGNINSDLSPIGTNVQWKYDVDGVEALEGVSQGGRAQQSNLSAGLSLDGLAYKVPAQVDFDYEVPVSGANKALAARVFSLTLKGYYRF